MTTYSPITYEVQVANGTTVPIHPSHSKGDILLVIARLRTTGKALGVPAGWERVAYNYGNGHSVVLGARVAESSSETSGTWESDLLTSVMLKGAEAVRPWLANGADPLPSLYGNASFRMASASSDVAFGGLSSVVPNIEVGAACHHLVYGDTHATAGISVPSGFTDMRTSDILTVGVKAFINTGAAVARPSVIIIPSAKNCGMSVFILPKKLSSSNFIPFF